ncbi:MAG: BsuBI/PstI family type II restriction endonuclease, partial [Rhodospirillaceae bacterium]|nr:BsuBI/PstI family type II restriction endonuclease [Rhodospirillaceae bacterium]
AAGASGVLVTFPNRETRQLAPGPSSIITQAVIEVFARNFLDDPAVLWLKTWIVIDLPSSDHRTGGAM